MKALITTDGSPESHNSIERYCRVRPHGITQHVVLTIDEFQAYGIIDSVDKAELDRIQHEHSLEILGKARAILDAAGIEAEYLERAGQSAETILQCAEELRADVIVIGARGASAFTRVLLGSTSDAVVSHAKMSVWVVRPGAEQHLDEPLHVTVAYDGSDASKYAIDFLRRMKFPSTAKVSLVSLVRRPDNLPDEIVYDSKQLEVSRKELEGFQADFGSDGPQVEIYVGETRHISHGLVEFAGKHHSSLVMVGDKGRSAIARFLMGSISRSVLHHAPCSVLVVKKPA